MPRRLRVETVGGLYHIMFRGNRRQAVFLDDHDRRFLLRKTRALKDRFDVEIYAFVLMPNHVHFLLRRMHDPIARFIQALLTTFARYFNRKYGLVGHVFQGRYRCLLCEDETYLLRLVRYLHRNPMRAGLSPNVEFDWSSYAAYGGQGRGDLVDTGPVLRRFGSDPVSAFDAFREFHESGDALADTSDDFMPRRGVFLGDERFEQREKRRAAHSADLAPHRRTSLDRILSDVIEKSDLQIDPIEVRGPSRRLAASLARASFVEIAVELHGYPYVEVAGFLGRSPHNLRVMLGRRRAARAAAAMVPKTRTVEPTRKE